VSTVGGVGEEGDVHSSLEVDSLPGGWPAVLIPCYSKSFLNCHLRGKNNLWLAQDFFGPLST
jgi:hypothetical protein